MVPGAGVAEGSAGGGPTITSPSRVCAGAAVSGAFVKGTATGDVARVTSGDGGPPGGLGPPGKASQPAGESRETHG
jgi:hypothetical protein